MTYKKKLKKYIIAYIVLYISMVVIIPFLNSNSTILDIIFVGITFARWFCLGMVIKTYFDKKHFDMINKHDSPKAKTFVEINSNSIKGTKISDLDNSNTPKTFRYNEQRKSYQSGQELNWFGCIISIIIVPPLGVYYVFKKLNDEPTNFYSNGVKLQFICIPFIIFGAVALPIEFGMLATNIMAWLTSVYPLVIGIVFLVIGSICRRKGSLFDRCMIIITEEQITNINTISSKLNLDYSKTCKLLNELINNDILVGAYINHHDSEIIVHGISKKIACKCKNCGGTTVLYYNEERICDYCGANL